MHDFQMMPSGLRRIIEEENPTRYLEEDKDDRVNEVKTKRVGDTCALFTHDAIRLA